MDRRGHSNFNSLRTPKQKEKTAAQVDKELKLTAAEHALDCVDYLVAETKESTDLVDISDNATVIRNFINDYRNMLERMCNARSLYTRVRETEVLLTKETFNEARALLGWDKVE